jgi:hypothetical protein
VSDRPAWQRGYVIATMAVIGGTLAYALCTWGGWTRLSSILPRHLVDDGPAHRADRLLRRHPVGHGGALVGGGLAAATALPPALPPPPVQLLAAWALTSFAIAALFYIWSMWPF